MVRIVLFGIHALLVILCIAGFCVSVANGDPAYPVFLAIVLLLAVCFGLWLQSRWTLVPCIAVIVLSALLAGAMVIGNIAWSEPVVNAIGIVSLLLLCLELATIVYFLYMPGAEVLDGVGEEDE